MKRLTVAAIAVALFSVALTAGAEDTVWTHQFGTAGIEVADDVAADSSAVYVSGITTGALPGQTNSGASDAFVRKYDSAGNELWTRQFGTDQGDRGGAVALDATNVYAVGLTRGAFPGEAYAGGTDVFVRKFASDGTAAWTREFGTPGFEIVLDAAVDASAIYVLLSSNGVFPGKVAAGGFDLVLVKIDKDGTFLWTRQFGSTGDDPLFGFFLGGVAVDDSGVYVASAITAPLPGHPGFGEDDGALWKFNFDGSQEWTRIIGSGCSDEATDVDVFGGDVFVGGATSGDLTTPLSAQCTNPPSPQRDYPPREEGFIQRYQADGQLVWTRQFTVHGGTSLLDGGIAADSSGVYAASEAFRGDETPDPGPNATCNRVPWYQNPDVDVHALSLAGATLWSREFGTRQSDVPAGVATTSSGVYVGGDTTCALAGETSFGSLDAFLVKLSK